MCIIYSNTYPVIFAMLYYTRVVFSMHVHEFYLMHPNTVYLNDNLTPLKPVRQSMMCIKYSENIIICVPKVRHKIHHLYILH